MCIPGGHVHTALSTCNIFHIPSVYLAEWLTCSSNWGFLRDFQISPTNDKVGATFGGKMCCHSGSTLMSCDVTKPVPSRNG